MRKLFITAFAALFLLPIGAFAQGNGAGEKNVIATSEAKTEVWRLKWAYVVPRDAGTLDLTFVKLNKGRYYIRFSTGTDGYLNLTKTPDRFSGTITTNQGDICEISGVINGRAVRGDWSCARSGHSGLLTGQINDEASK
jgi:hypothetical protein